MCCKHQKQIVAVEFMSKKNFSALGALCARANKKSPLLLFPLLLVGCGTSRSDQNPSPLFDAPPAVASQVEKLEEEIFSTLALAHVHMEAGRLHEAQAKLSALLEKDPGNAWAMLNLGVVMQRMGLLTRARELYASVAAMPQAKNMAAGKHTDAVADKSLGDLARHNLRSVNRQLLRERMAREGVLARQTSPAPEEVKFGMAAPKAAEFASVAEALPVTAGLDEQKVLLAVFGWRESWMQRRFGDYVAHYVPGFAPVGGGNRQWLDLRQLRISGARDISIELDGIKVQQLLNDDARVKFRQFYRDQRYSDVGCKTLDLQQVNGKWLIRSESFVKLGDASGSC
jgi:hypothetical protein